MKRNIFFISAVFLLIFNCMNLFAEGENDTAVKLNESAEKQWFTIKSGYLNIYCDQDVNLKSVTNRLSRRGLFEAGVYNPNSGSVPSEKIAYMMDRLLKRVKDILDMWPEKMDLKIKIFKDRDALNSEYCRIFGTTPDYKSFYIYKYDTIYTSEEDISDSVLAHEMGHAIVDHYFSKTPPTKISELMAQYVDLHLED